MLVYRIARKRFINDLSGEGSRLYGGRWNLVGTPCLYASQNAALCLLEFVVQFSRIALPTDVAMAKIEIPDDLKIIEIDRDDLPLKWDEPLLNSASQKFGAQQFSNIALAGFKIPSVVSPFEFNFVLNPQSVDYHKIKVISVEDFQIDHRLQAEV